MKNSTMAKHGTKHRIPFPKNSFYSGVKKLPEKSRRNKTKI